MVPGLVIGLVTSLTALVRAERMFETAAGVAVRLEIAERRTVACEDILSCSISRKVDA